MKYKRKDPKPEIKSIDEKGLPTEAGVYLVKGMFNENELGEIDVYEHPIKGLCCFCDDFGSSGTEGVDDDTGCHVSVQCTGLEFITRVRDLK